MKSDQDLFENLWYDLRKLLWQPELNPRVRCAFGNVSCRKTKNLRTLNKNQVSTRRLVWAIWSCCVLPCALWTGRTLICWYNMLLLVTVSVPSQSVIKSQLIPKVKITNNQNQKWKSRYEKLVCSRLILVIKRITAFSTQMKWKDCWFVAVCLPDVDQWDEIRASEQTFWAPKWAQSRPELLG